MAKASIKSPREIELMRECCRIVAEVLRILKKCIQAGVTTRELDAMAEEYILSRKGEPAFKGYGADPKNRFPASLCTSVEDEVVHGIPGSRMLREGEIVSLDVGVKKGGFYGDGAWTFPVGRISDEKSLLLKSAEESLYTGIAQARAGNRVHDISAAVQSHVERDGFSVVRDLVGHGVGRELHEEPAIPNYGQRGTGPVLEKGGPRRGVGEGEGARDRADGEPGQVPGESRRRRLDDPHGRRISLGALRAHDPRDRRRTGNTHTITELMAKQGPITMDGIITDTLPNAMLRERTEEA